MKKIVFALSMAAGAVLFNSCEEIDGDFYRVITVDERCEPFVFDPTPENPKRNILVEDFTGHQCPNCPAAAETAATLEEENNGQVIVMAIHPTGVFSKLTPPTFVYDFTTPSGDEIADNFGVSGLPAGMVNRTEYDGKTVLGRSRWTPAVNAALDLPAIAYVEVQARYQESDDAILCIDTKVDMLTDYNTDIIVYSAIVESEINQPQLDGSVTDVNYIHNHVLRESPLGALGVPLGASPYSSTDEFTQRISLTKGADWVAGNLKIISFIYDKNTFEILQVAENHVEVE